MRKTADLIEELHSRADGLWAAVLVIGYEESSEMIWSYTPARDALAALNAHVERGGAPIGFLGFERPLRGGGGAEVRMQAVDEYAGAEWAEKFLLTLVGQMRRLAEGREAS
jgi:hypothetical protein